MTVVGCISVLCCCKLTCHGTTIAREDNTVLRYDNRSLHGTAIIIVSYVACDALCVHVALIVTVIDAAAVLINREALGLRKMNAVVEHEATPAILGMVEKVKHLVKVID